MKILIFFSISILPNVIPLFAFIVSKFQKKYWIYLDIILLISIYMILIYRNLIFYSFDKFAGYNFVIFYLGSILAMGLPNNLFTRRRLPSPAGVDATRRLKLPSTTVY
jgi:hypothetical protein